MKRKCPECNNVRTIEHNRKICQGCRAFGRRLKSGEILPPEFEDITTDGYKEPMQRVEDGFSYYGALTRSKLGSHIQCHTCGFFFANLGAHIRMKHNITAREYKIKYGLRITEGLVSPLERQRMQVRYNKSARVGHLQEITRKANTVLREKIANGELKNGGDMWTAQTRNEKGMCREQTLAKIRNVAKANEGVAVYRTFLETYGEGQRYVIGHWFTNWDNAVKEAGVVSHKQAMRATSEQRVLSVIEAIKVFYEDHGRTPQSSDFNSENGFPPQRVVSKMFGGLNNARREAGVPVLVNLGNGTWVEDEAPRVAKTTQTMV